MRVLIADDESPARRKLVRFLNQYPDVEIVAEASNGPDAVDLANITRPDVVFLDVHMPDLDGLGVAEALVCGDAPPHVVFVTAFDTYAVAAFDVNAIDYLLKPFDRRRLETALGRIRAAAGSQSAEVAALLAYAQREQRFAQRLLASGGDDRSRFVNVEDIVWIEAASNHILLHCRDGGLRMRVTLEAVETRLDPARFARIHRSHIVNIDHVSEVHPWFHGDYKVRMRSGEELTWSRRYASRRSDLLKL